MSSGSIDNPMPIGSDGIDVSWAMILRLTSIINTVDQKSQLEMPMLMDLSKLEEEEEKFLWMF